jgi:type IV secretion system protein TrbL
VKRTALRRRTPLKRAASGAVDSLKSSYQAGSRAAFESTGGAVAGETAAAEAAPSAESTPPTSDGPPAWAQRMKRSQTMTHGVQAAAHAVRSGDSHGGGSSVDLSESE